jgi:hypothetical protein
LNIEEKNIMKNDTTSYFCAYVLLPDIENYKGDAFITYGQIEKMKVGEKAIIITRKNGCEFIGQSSVAKTLWNAWKSYAINIYEITRIVEKCFHVPAVEYTNISPEIAEKLVEEYENNALAKNLAEY